jgi:glycosyltransferase involved in cell wall biosynthesis
VRIAWATPINHRSAIGRVSADVVDRLVARGHEVCVLATEWEADGTPPHPVGACVIPWREVDPDTLARDHDVLVANVGDHFLFHGGMFALFGRLPTVGVFHDFYLYDLFNGWLWSGGRPAEDQARRRREIAKDVYGEGVLPALGRAESGQLPLADLARDLPMTEWMAAYCQGALAHSGFYLDRLAAGCPGPVGQAAMPVTGRGVAALPERESGRAVLLTVGVMNPNKCVAETLAAIGASPSLRHGVTYRLAGPISPDERARLEQLAESVGFAGLEICGEVSDSALREHLDAADIICCLRRPVLEGASGSAIEGLLAGRPVIVADVGFYRDLPDDLVFKVPDDIPTEALGAQLSRLVSNEPLRRQAGAAAADWAQAHFDLDAYADAIERLAEDTLRAFPVLQVAAGWGHGLRRLGLTPDDPAAPRIAAALAEIFPTA